MDWPGCCSCALNCANGMTRKHEKCWQTLSHSKMPRSIGCLPDLDLFATTKTVRDDKRVFGGRSHKIKPHRIAADETGQKHFEEQTDHHDGESAQPAQHDSLNAQQHLPAHGRERFDCAIAKPTRCHPASVGLPQGVCDLYSLLRVVKYIPETGCAHEQLKQHDAEAFHN